METETGSGKQTVFFVVMGQKNTPHNVWAKSETMRAGPLCRYFGAYMELLLKTSMGEIMTSLITTMWPFLIMRPTKAEGRHIGFSADLGRRRRRRRDSCIHHISWINGWDSTKFAWAHHWNKPKSWLSFGDFDPIFKVTGGLRLKFSASAWQILICTISLEPMDGMSLNLQGYIIGTSLRVD